MHSVLEKVDGWLCRDAETMYQTTKFSASSSLMPQRPGGQAVEPWAPTPAGAGGPSFSAGSPGVSGGTAAAAKQRLRWTPELHERFVDAVTQLGGPDREFPFYQSYPLSCSLVFGSIFFREWQLLVF
jgi:hypothetical protein